MQRNSTDNNGKITIIVVPRVLRCVSRTLRRIAMPPTVLQVNDFANTRCVDE